MRDIFDRPDHDIQPDNWQKRRERPFSGSKIYVISIGAIYFEGNEAMMERRSAQQSTVFLLGQNEGIGLEFALTPLAPSPSTLQHFPFLNRSSFYFICASSSTNSRHHFPQLNSSRIFLIIQLYFLSTPISLVSSFNLWPRLFPVLILGENGVKEES
jgi:hypothetical protein